MSHTTVNGERLIIYCKESDRREGMPLFEWLLGKAMEMKLAGGTVHKGVTGFGQHLKLHHEHLLAIGADLPMMVVLVDTPEQISGYLGAAGDSLVGYTFTREPVVLHQPNA